MTVVYDLLFLVGSVAIMTIIFLCVLCVGAVILDKVR